MAKKDKEVKEQQPEAEKVEGPAVQEPEKAPEVNPFEEKYNAEHDSYLRLAADYDNYRKRTAKEKEQSYSNGKADTILKLLPIYDNLERAMSQDTEDAAYKKGVEMTMTELGENFHRAGRGDLRGGRRAFRSEPAQCRHAHRGRPGGRKHHHPGVPEGLQAGREDRPVRNGPGGELIGASLRLPLEGKALDGANCQPLPPLIRLG